MADYQRRVLLSVLMNEIDSSLDTGQQFTAYADYDEERPKIRKCWQGAWQTQKTAV